MTWNECLHAFCHGLRSCRVRKLQVFAPNISLALTHTCTYTRAYSRSNAIDLKSAPAVIGICKRWMVCVNRSACVEDHWFPRATESLGLRLREDVPSEERPDFLDQTHFIRRQTSSSRGKGGGREEGGWSRRWDALGRRNGLSCETLMRTIMASGWKEGPFGVEKKALGRIRGNVG